MLTFTREARIKEIFVNINFRKGANAFALSISMLICGTIFAAAGLLNPYMANSTSTALRLTHIFTSELADRGKLFLVVGGVWLLFSFAGSFFSFKTDDLMMRVWKAIIVMMLVTLGYLGVIIVAGISILQNPWTAYVFMGLVGVLFLLISSTLFLHAARMSDKPDSMEKLLRTLIESGKVVVMPSRNHHNH